MNRALILASWIAASSLGCALLLALPGGTITTAFVNDLLIFLDGAHRVSSGQVPNRDFHTALGPVVYYLPALGYWLSGRFGGAMPVGMGLLILAFAPVMWHVLGSRYRLFLALPMAAFLIGLLALPANLGEDLSSISFAMFYNRIGWAALALLLLMYVRPFRASRTQSALDAVCAALLVLLQVYTKVTYGVVALAFLVFMLLDPRQRRWAAGAILLVLIAAVLVELVWKGSFQHIQDLLDTARVSGTRGFEALVFAALNNLADMVVFGLLAILALWQTRSFRDFLFYGFCAGSGLVLLVQNAHSWGIITLFAAAGVAAQTIAGPCPSARRADAGPSRSSISTYGGLPFLAMVLPPTVSHFAALLLHFALAVSGFGQPFGLKNFNEVRFGRLWTPGDYGYSEKYIGSFSAGAELLGELGFAPERVLDLDFITPFSAGLGIEPPRGDESWMHWGRNVDAEHFLPPQTLFADVLIVMIPKIGINSGQLDSVYGRYIAQNFDLVRDTDQWRVFVRPHEQGAKQ